MTAHQPASLSVTLNGARRTASVDTRLLLVEALRDVFGATGPKIGCATGDCGACTIRLGDAPIKSCLVLAVAANEAEITTIEGIGADGSLTPLQEAFWDEYAFQCGYCLSGMLFAAQDLLDRNAEPSEDEIRAAISGNLCRCTGYDNIVAAVRRAAASYAELKQDRSSCEGASAAD
jgi:carbon-monoxide dehydrogenase small subunit